MRSWCGILLAVVLAAQPLLAAGPLWLAVTHTTKRTGASYYPEIVQTQAEQATLALDKPAGHAVYGESSPQNLCTRRLQFVCRGKTYAVPEPFVEDLLWLGADSSVRASIHGQDTVFTMSGASGEKAYTVHFQFRAGRFCQRILDYTAAHTILIRTNDAEADAAR